MTSLPIDVGQPQGVRELLNLAGDDGLLDAYRQNTQPRALAQYVQKAAQWSGKDTEFQQVDHALNLAPHLG